MACLVEAPFADVNPNDLAAIIQLQLEDAEELVANAKGKGRAGRSSDAEMSLQMYEEALRSCAATLADRRMAYSMSVAVQDDGEILQHTVEQNKQIVADNLLANKLQGRHGSGMNMTDLAKKVEGRAHMMDKEVAAAWSDPEMLAKAAALFNQPKGTNSTDSLVPIPESESSSRAAARGTAGIALTTRCVACGDEKEFYGVARVPCDHEYCRPCLEELFRLSLKDETLFPPRCDGQEIPLGRVSFFLPQPLVHDFVARYAELSTKNRTYCHERSCPTFIPKDAIENEVGACPTCNKTTCTICKLPSHSGDCPQDSALQDLIETATLEQWQRCYGCNRFVELQTGCNHMTCPCGAHFCYVCGQKWKTCQCEQWDEHRLVDRAEQLIARNPRRQLFQPAHIEHEQPPTRAATPDSTIATVRDPTISPAGPISRPEAQLEWQLDTSDADEWEPDCQPFRLVQPSLQQQCNTFATIMLAPMTDGDIAWVGEGRSWSIGRINLYIRSIWDSPTLLQQGYDEFSRHGKPFVFANLFTGAEVLLPLKYMDWLHDQPESTISSFEAHREFMRADWTFLHPTIFHEHVFERVIKLQLTRQLDELTPELADEARFAIDGLAAEGAFELVDHADWKAIVLQTVSRIYVGLPLCRDEEYLEAAATFNDMSMLVAALISLIPSSLRPALAPILCLRDRWLHLRCAAKTKPIILDRIKRMQKSGSDGLPHDLITWAVQDAFDSAQPEKQCLDFLAARISMMNFVSIDSTSITIENVLYDILSNPDDRHTTPSAGTNLLDDLRAEAEAAYDAHHGKKYQWKNIINNLPLLDACLKESFRLNNFISRTNVRKVVAQEGVEVPGVGRIPQGTVLAVSLWGAHHDAEAYEDPTKWRMSRWLPGSGREKVSVFGKGSSKSTKQYLPFGYRRHACPGRFFAHRIVKLIIVHLLLEYDIEMMVKERPWNPWLGVSRGPPVGGKVKFTRLRQCV